MDHRTPPRPRSAARAVLGLCAALGVLAPAVPARAQVSAEESAKKLKPAEGLEATLWASEPLVVNPTNMDVDSRGRVWVSEGLNYRLTHGNKPFKRIEDADKIKILEDTDGDGKADKVTVFADRIYPIQPRQPGHLGAGRGQVRLQDPRQPATLGRGGPG
jgi:hypothetical protein